MKEQVLKAMRDFGAPVNAGKIAEITGLDRKAILMETLRILKKGGTFAIHDLFSRQNYGDMQAFVKKLKALGGSAILFGKK